MYDLNTEPQWKSWQKFAFRFLFLFLGFFLLNYELVLIFLTFNEFDKVSLIYDPLQKPLFWMDRHFYHTGYNPAIHENLPADNHYGVVFYVTAAILFLFISAFWSFVDRGKPNYQKLNYGFGIYIRYMTALVMLGYGIDKLIPTQMGYPDVTELLKPIGGQDLFSVAWNFVGASPGYEIFAGACEIIGSLLLVFRRTYVFGALFMCSVLCNVIAINVFYNISVKLYSTLTLICVLFLLVPYANTLIQFFFRNRTISLAENKWTFKETWKRYLFLAFGILLIGGTILVSILRGFKAYQRQIYNKQHQKLYGVSWFIAKDTLQPVLTDTVRWKKFALVTRKRAVVYNMKDSAAFYDFDKDSVKRIYRLHDNPDTSKWDELHYSYPLTNQLKLSGKWKGMDVQIMMEETPIDSMTLNKEKLVFLQD
jgi:hypothetical protein